MNNLKNILITGATGFLGSFLAREFLDKGYNIYALARAKGNKSAQERIEGALKFVYEDEWNPEFVFSHLKVVEGDITQADLGVKSPETKEFLTSEIDIIFHSAALAELRVPLDIIRRINVEGTRNVLDFALKCKEKGRLRKVNHISTAYVVGTKKNINFSEDMLELGQGFHNTYEQTKYEAEILVKEYQKKGLQIAIFRPSLIIGDSKSGRINGFQHIYKLLHLLANKIFDEYPINLKCSQNLVNIDTVAHLIFILGEKDESKTYHLVSPEDINVKFLLKLASNYFEFRMPKCIPEEKFNFNKLTTVQKILIEPLTPYFNFKTKFLSENTQKIVKEYNFKYPEVNKNSLFKIFSYYINTRFIKRK